MRWRLGIDLGTNSLGWAALSLAGDEPSPTGILAAGSRIFSDGRDPKSKQSLAVDRRLARGMRRRRDRFLQRQRALMHYLVADGLFPADPAERKALEVLDPFELRARALDAELTLPQLGRALWHLNQRRGFKSNRKTDRADADAGKVAVGIDRLKHAIEDAGARTFGEFLYLRRLPEMTRPNDDPKKRYNHSHVPSIRTRLRSETGDGKNMAYDYYPGRDLVSEEFDEILAKQTEYHAAVLTPEVRARLHEIVFHQRPLKTPEVGTCTLVAGERRLPKAHPLFQRRRLLEELNALMIVRPGEKAARLTPEQRDILLLKIKDKAKVSFESLRKTLKLEAEARFNKESENRKELKGDEVAAMMGTKTRFGTRWVHLSTDAQWQIIERLEATQSDTDVAAFRAWVGAAYALSDEQAAAVANAYLPQGHGRFGHTATTALIDALTHERTADGRVVVYSEAVARCGWHHSDFRTDDHYDALPYYGIALERHIMPGSGDPSDSDEKRYGKLTNPTVHIGLNQLRRTVNRLIARYGPPEQIAVELARELKLTEEEKSEKNRENKRNREDAERRSRKLVEIGVEDNGANRARLKLWEELDGDNCLSRTCVYTGQQISIRMLFSDAVEIDHILPFAATLDDSNANKIVCLREANREKRKRSPWEAWGDGPHWEAIAARASRLPRNKRWRFEPDAMHRFADDGGFLARQLIDTQYLARLARDYLSSLYPGTGEGTGRVWVSPGRLTEMVRRKLGLNDVLPDHNFGGGAGQPKNRLDHRHHAIDAIVIAVVDRPLLNRIARISGLQGTEGREKIEIPAPWGDSVDRFRSEVYDAMQAIVVSHRPDHGTAGHGLGSTAGRLHNDTAYGLTGVVDGKGNMIVVRRKALSAMKPADIAAVRDLDLRAALTRVTEGLDGKAFLQALERVSEFGVAISSKRGETIQFKNIRRIRLVETLGIVPIRDREGHAYKGYKGDSNYRYDIWEMPDGKWRADVVSMFAAHQAGERPRPHPAARRIMQLHRDDVLAIERDSGLCELLRIVKFTDPQMALAPPNEGGALKARDADRNDPFKYVLTSPNTLKAWRARKVSVDETGHVRDPGFGARTAVRRTRPKPAA